MAHGMYEFLRTPGNQVVLEGLGCRVLSGGTSTSSRLFRSACWDPSSNVGDVKDIERLEHFAIMSGLAPQSVDAIRPDFRRCVRYMKENGVTEIPDSPLTGSPLDVNLASMAPVSGLHDDNVWKPLVRLVEEWLGLQTGSCKRLISADQTA